MSEKIVYITRDRASGIVANSGAFGGGFNFDTANRLAQRYDVKITQSGTPVFVSKTGMEVDIYIKVIPLYTDKGREAMALYQAEERRLAALRAEKEKEEQQRIDELMGELSNEEIIRRLSAS